MSRIDDDKAAQRALEQNQANQRQQKQKRDAQKTERFSQLVADKTRNSQLLQTGRRLFKQKGEGDEVLRQLREKILPEDAQDEHEATRRSALMEALTDPSEDTGPSKGPEKSDESQEDDKDALKSQDNPKAETPLSGSALVIGDDPTQENGSQRDSNASEDEEEEDAQQSKSVHSTKKARVNPKKTKEDIPAKLIEDLVSQIYAAIDGEGNTSVRIELGGGLFDGVELNVRTEGREVHCAFKGCDRDLRHLLVASRGALMRGLSKRGFTLSSLVANAP